MTFTRSVEAHSMNNEGNTKWETTTHYAWCTAQTHRNGTMWSWHSTEKWARHAGFPCATRRKKKNPSHLSLSRAPSALSWVREKQGEVPKLCVCVCLRFTCAHAEVLSLLKTVPLHLQDDVEASPHSFMLMSLGVTWPAVGYEWSVITIAARFT